MKVFRIALISGLVASSIQANVQAQTPGGLPLAVQHAPAEKTASTITHTRWCGALLQGLGVPKRAGGRVQPRLAFELGQLGVADAVPCGQGLSRRRA